MGGFEMSGKKPEKVLKAMEDDDASALKAMARAGGRKAGAMSAERADARALTEALKKEAEKSFIDDAGEHERNILENVPLHDR